MCYACALRNLKDLAYSYRADIDKKELPGNFTNAKTDLNQVL